MSKGIIDRFEGEFAVIEVERKTIDVPRKQIAHNAEPGDVVELKDGIWVPDKEETASRKARIEKLASEVWAEE
jgi:hypothetical protein